MGVVEIAANFFQPSRTRWKWRPGGFRTRAGKSEQFD
jgi:hypothetical protein